MPTPDPPGENYDQFARVLFSYTETLEARVRVVQVPSKSLPRDPSAGKPLSRPNVLAEIVGFKNYPILHFNGHYDVVPTTGIWTSDLYKPEVREGRVYGRGAHDMKLGIAAILVAAKAIKLENI